MKKNLYYKQVARIKHIQDQTFQALAQTILSVPSPMLQVFTRRDFGPRHINMVRIIITVIFYGWVPMHNHSHLHGSNIFFLFMEEPAYYFYLLAVVVMGIIDAVRNHNEPGVFDFARFSFSNGVFFNYFDRMASALGRNRLWKDNIRQREIILEPGFFAAVGIVLMPVSELLGGMLVINAIIYCCSKSYAYSLGDTFVMDFIDQQIASEDMVANFAGEEHENRGFEFRGHMPNTEEGRRQFMDFVIVDESAARDKESQVI